MIETGISLQSALSLHAILTGATCGDGCWHARELVCRCSCGGANHGILLNADGKRPQRTCKIDGNFYELAGIVAREPDTLFGDCYNSACDATNALLDERFPGLFPYAYGEYCPENTLPAVHRKISATQAKWPEVQAVPGAMRLIWARPAGTRYLVRGPNHTNVYNDEKVTE